MTQKPPPFTPLTPEQVLTREQALAGAIASNEIEGLTMSDEDLALAKRWAAGELTGDGAIAEFMRRIRKDPGDQGGQSR